MNLKLNYFLPVAFAFQPRDDHPQAALPQIADSAQLAPSAARMEREALSELETFVQRQIWRHRQLCELSLSDFAGRMAAVASEPEMVAARLVAECDAALDDLRDTERAQPAAMIGRLISQCRASYLSIRQSSVRAAP